MERQLAQARGLMSGEGKMPPPEDGVSISEAQSVLLITVVANKSTSAQTPGKSQQAKSITLTALLLFCALAQRICML